LIAPRPDGVNLVTEAQQFLHVMGNLMGNHISSGKLPSSLMPLLELRKEGWVDVNLLVTGAIERPNIRGRHPASGLDTTGKHYELRRLVSSALNTLFEQPRPDSLCIAKHDLDEIPFVVRLARLAGLPGWGLLLSLSLLLLLLLEQLLSQSRVKQESDPDDQQHQEPAATDSHGRSDATPIFHVTTLFTTLPTHGTPGTRRQGE
jgi:hypothetical protein